MAFHQAGTNDQWQSTNPTDNLQPQQRSWPSRHKALTAVLAVVGFFLSIGVLSAALGGGSGDDAVAAGFGAAETSEASQPKPAGEKSTAGVGDKVRDGNFEFVVTKVEEGGTRIGDEFLNEEAQGVFQLVHVTITNTSDQPQMVSDSNQMVKDQEGRQFAPDSAAAILLDNNALWIEEINPGNTLNGTLVYDMPADSKPTAIELHDSMMSGGVTVSLK
ncbi:MAG: DUF4352 domain-containing protein [Micrococcales bacterium]|nr:MAG: DUF4352 domain-containing protein [Micrococcales bacterium]PIE25770.1 MAG: DUF4352 domain-containing protein [Micrococcales bacterium]PIE26597.1 MAG: DUF4352 domain-containing protein [Micrococcales bacterium]